MGEVLPVKLRILSYNVHKGFGWTPGHFTLPQLRDAIRTTGAEVCFLQEVVGTNDDLQKRLPSWPTESQFEFLADEVWPHYSYGRNAVFPGRHHGNAILSKYPISFVENINLTVHALEQRGLLHCQVELPFFDFPLDLFNTHLNLLHLHRKLQIQQIFDRIQRLVPPSKPLVLAGDFNDWGQRLSPLLKNQLEIVECFEMTNGGPPKTFPSFWPRLALDRVYVRHCKVISAKVLEGHPWRQISDHLPLLVDLQIQGP